MKTNRFALAAAFAGALALSACDTAREIEDSGGGGGGACNVCHGFPPPQTVSNHPQIDQCVLCHANTVDANNDLVPGGPHNDGTVDVTFTGHPGGFASPSVHGPAAISDLATCQACHGADFGGDYGPSCNACHQAAGWNAAALTTNCTFCHGTPTQPDFVFADDPALAAPPEGVAGATSPTDPTVGAHQAHLAGGVACGQCHTVPTDLGHIADGAAGAELVWGNLATLNGTVTPTYAGGNCTNYCHGATLADGTATTPSWTGGGLDCSSCHGNPPLSVAPHDASTTTCSDCHTAGPGPGHVDGVVNLGNIHAAGYSDPAVHGPDAIADISTCQSCHGADFGGDIGPSCNACHQAAGWNATALTTNCTFCHGTKTKPSFTFASNPPLAAPPEGVAGATAVTDPTVGAHQAHLTGGTYSTPIACAQCHAVPADLAHLNGTATLTWGSLATANGATPTFTAGQTCTNYCHGSTLDGGVNKSPSFTETDLGATAVERCAACHGSFAGTPPSLRGPATGEHSRHVVSQGYQCWYCHSTVTPDTPNTAPALQADRSLHLNGLKNVSFGLGIGTWDPAGNSGRGTCSGVGCHGSRSWY